ncbi:hypothetical protein PILCRDRAFT_15597 [Piloderma croceum F 1598]|uniref:Uncharacterized protein n=1 Tax=Piloderma croceum (strain F 1598) TaxID=765440 RepID=A0A0C3EYF0_PILCF|nr:hypothetical protein PILCRDRAFT_15597 [Piloderma croceum F 1598]
MSDPGVIFANAHPICHINGHGSDAFVIACLTPQAFFSGQPHLKHNHPKIPLAERRVYLCPSRSSALFYFILDVIRLASAGAIITASVFDA